MPTIVVSDPYNISTDFCNPYPSAQLPGVYIICDSNNQILRIGKASCNSNITTRLSSYFRWGKKESEGVHKHTGYDNAKILYTIGVPKEHAFEAPAIEEYLIVYLKPPYNKNGLR